MFYLKIEEKEIDYNKLFEDTTFTFKEKQEYIKIMKKFNKEIQDNRNPTIFKYIKDRKIKTDEEDHLELLSMLMIIEKEGGIDKIKEKADYFFSKIKSFDMNTHDIWLSYNCSLLMFYNSIYNLDVNLFSNAKMGMNYLNCYLKNNMDVFKHEDNER